jgi:hypothetical protein
MKFQVLELPKPGDLCISLHCVPSLQYLRNSRSAGYPFTAFKRLCDNLGGRVAKCEKLAHSPLTGSFPSIHRSLRDINVSLNPSSLKRVSSAMSHRFHTLIYEIFGHRDDALFQGQAERAPEFTLQKVRVCQKSFARAVHEGKASNLSVGW